jgi:acyl carrier protein
MDTARIEEIILSAVTTANLARPANAQLEASATAQIYGPESRLDSLGLVALLIDIEDAFQDVGCPITLSDARAMSQARSPFRDVPSLVAYISGLIADVA